ncbi:MAG: HEPN domain-containing protein [Candidatus Electrothrix sp. AW2]|nr:HEPN domain-containing protein [Candidatus Electrothrix sp. AX1]MCI5135369.1 HEPN domain-containing protein [Candidatus Electrothrix gigas]MCI5182113.1 HEPN domain-containing protein [Candidatus Electrothrix gigas]
MNIEEHIQYWLESAEHDWETAENLFTAKKYDWSLFIGHLVLEKILKAVFVQKNNNKLPPKTHNLLRLAEQSRIELSEEQEMLLDRVSEFNIETRYPQYKNEFYKKCTSEFAEEYFRKIEEMAAWLKSRIQPAQS